MSGSFLKASKAWGPSSLPPNTILALFLSPYSMAYFISSPGVKGLKSVGNPLIMEMNTWEYLEWPEPDFETKLPEETSQVIFELIGFGLEGLANDSEILLVVNLRSL